MIQTFVLEALLNSIFLSRQEIEEWAEVFAGNNFARHTVHSPETFQARVCI